jgi:hypothetical protein
MKLYEIPERSKIFIESSDGSSYLFFAHIDGAYSYCITEKGGVAHLAAWTELEAVDGGYKLVEV